ncbi:MAG: FHA domain-containing protein [Anaerolineae bacterium]|nr:FHA domain-containing protein [Anaerolineae bacterium]
MSAGKLVEQASGQVYPLGFEVVTIGRHPDNTVVVPDPQASRHHAEITMQGSRWVMQDLGSANGTYVNGERIVGPHVLKDGDLLGIGQARFSAEISTPISVQDTLVERRRPGPARLPAESRRRAILFVGLATIAILAVILAVALLLQPRDLGPSQPSDQPATTPVAGGPAHVSNGSPTVPSTSRPTATALPTIAPASLRPTLLPRIHPTPQIEPTSLLPFIGYFRAEPSTIAPGECTRLQWGDIGNATRLVLSGVGQVDATGKIDVCPDSSTTYTLEATGGGGTTQRSTEVTLQQPPGPIIEYFRVVPSIIAPGDCAQLEWGTVQNALSASVEPGIGGVGTPGSAEVCPGATTTYILAAQSPEGTGTARATLIVSSEAVQQPVIAFFTANPANIQAGECTTLGWGKVDYATTVTIDNGIGGVGTPGSRELCPAATTEYVMKAEGPGGTSEARLTVTVSPGRLADLPDLIVESILFEPNPCFRLLKCKVRVKVRNDGTLEAGHFVVRWAPQGAEAVPVEWDLPGLPANQDKVLSYTWIPARVEDRWPTSAQADAYQEVEEIEEGLGNVVEQTITVVER